MSTFLNLYHPASNVKSTSSIYRPPSYPPPDEFVLAEDDSGKPLSRYGDSTWDFRFYGEGTIVFDAESLTSENLSLIKQLMFFVLYGNMFKGKIRSSTHYLYLFKKIGKICSKQNVRMDELSRFPKLHAEVSGALSGPQFELYVGYLHRLLLWNQDIGFIVADKKTIKNFVQSYDYKHVRQQYPYIPQRLWGNVEKRARHFLEDILAHKKEITDAYTWIESAFTNNVKFVAQTYSSPFGIKDHQVSNLILYDGSFNDFLEDKGCLQLFDDYIETQNSVFDLRSFSKLLTLVRDIALTYILMFSMQRNSEVLSMRTDCFEIENDPKLGQIGILSGETTKTDPDSDARWIVPSHVKIAVDTGSFISCLRCHPSYDKKSTPPSLALKSSETWYPTRPNTDPISAFNVSTLVSSSPKIFPKEELITTESDWRIAVSITPTIALNEKFGPGKPWLFFAHQFRRTTIVNMFRSGEVNETSIQWNAKHLNVTMSLYYGRNYSNFILNKDVGSNIILESYRNLSQQIVDVVEEAVNCVRPHKQLPLNNEIVNLVTAKDEKKLIELIRNQKLSCRKTLAGWCMSQTACPYGGIESLSSCAGTVGNGNMCAELIINKDNKDSLAQLKERHLSIVSDDHHSPKNSALLKEVRAIEILLNVIEK